MAKRGPYWLYVSTLFVLLLIAIAAAMTLRAWQLAVTVEQFQPRHNHLVALTNNPEDPIFLERVKIITQQFPGLPVTMVQPISDGQFPTFVIGQAMSEKPTTNYLK